MTYKPTWFALAMVLSGTVLSYLFAMLPKDTQVKTFCAYNRAFIEFTDGKSTWGTMMLDRDGKPIPCDDREEIKSSTNLIRT